MYTATIPSIRGKHLHVAAFCLMCRCCVEMCEVCCYAFVYIVFYCVWSQWDTTFCTAAESRRRVEWNEGNDANQVCLQEEKGDTSDGACSKGGAVFTDTLCTAPSPHQTLFSDQYMITCTYVIMRICGTTAGSLMVGTPINLVWRLISQV